MTNIAFAQIAGELVKPLKKYDERTQVRKIVGCYGSLECVMGYQVISDDEDISGMTKIHSLAGRKYGGFKKV